MDKNELLLFSRVYEMQNISHAAKEFFLTPQGASNVIKRIEKEYHCELFIRTPYGLEPTTHGDILYQHGQYLLKDYQALEDALTSHTHSLGRHIRVVFPAGLLSYLTMQYLEEYTNKFPDIDLQYEECFDSEICSRLENNLTDIAVMGGPIDFNRYHGKHFTSSRCLAMINKKSPLCQKEFISFSDFEGMNLIMLGSNFNAANSYQNYLCKYNVRVASIHHTYDVARYRDFVKNPNNVGLLVDFTALDILSDETTVRPLDPDVSFDTFFIHLSSKTPSPEVENFINFSMRWYHTHKNKLLHYQDSPT